MVVKVSGFGQESSSSEKETKPSSDKTLSEIDSMMQNISKEAGTYQDFENKLVKELQTVRDMEDNLQVINNQVKNMRRLAMGGEEIIRNLMNEYNKGSKNVDINKCQALFEAIKKINQEMTSNIELARTELAKLFVTQRHQLYAESEENKRMMTIISEDAKRLITEIVIISNNHNGHSQTLEELYNHLMQIREQKSRQESK